MIMTPAYDPKPKCVISQNTKKYKVREIKDHTNKKTKA